MLVIVLKDYDPGLAGKLSRWLLQAAAGVFVGEVSKRVQEGLLKIAKGGCPKGLTWIESGDFEQGFRVLTFGNPSYSLEDFDGLPLISRRIHRRSVKSE